jgi:hypothetical protein
MTRTEPDVARHEASHAVIFLACGVRPSYVDAGACHCPRTAPPEVIATAAVAGCVGNRIRGVADYLSDRDFEALRLALEKCGQSPCRRVIHHFEQEAARILGEYRPQVDAIQELLVRERHVTFDDLQRATITDRRLEQFRCLFPTRKPAEKQRVAALGKSRQWKTAQTGCNIFGGVRRT